jgi:hypothetical protein
MNLLQHLIPALKYLLMIAIVVAIVFVGFYQLTLLRRPWFWALVAGTAVLAIIVHFSK